MGINPNSIPKALRVGPQPKPLVRPFRQTAEEIERQAKTDKPRRRRRKRKETEDGREDGN